MGEVLHILALDPSARATGVARWRVDGEPWAGTWRTESDDAGERLHEIRDNLHRKIVAFRDRCEPITHVYLENFNITGFVRSGTQAQTLTLLAQVQGVVLEVCAATRTPCERVAISSWRKSFLGFGTKPKGFNWKTAAKDQCARLGIKVDSADAAEAVGILWHARCEEDPVWAATGATRLFRRAS